MRNMQKYVAEFLGTMVLVMFGCGSAVGINKLLATQAVIPLGFSTLLIAVAFGLAVMVVAYTFGSVSGGHVNPAVSLAACLSGKMEVSECIKYIVSQFLGGIVGAAVLVMLFNSNTSLGANGFGELSALGTVWYRALAVETIATTVFVLVVLCVTSKKETSAMSGLLIGLALTVVHIFAIPFTGTSVNPARSFGPALFTGGVALEQVWLFIVAPLCGAVIAALIYKYLIQEKNAK